MNRRVLLPIIGSLLLPLGCDGPADPAVRLEPSQFCSDHPDAAIATFEDANLEAAIRSDLLVGPQEPLTCGLISGLTALDVHFAGITSLAGIQNFTSVTRLELNNNSITDIGRLSGLTSLTTLELGSNSISDIGALSGLTSLTELYLYRNSISDIGTLNGVTSLAFLFLGFNSITDIGALSGLTSLAFLTLQSNPDLTNHSASARQHRARHRRSGLSPVHERDLHGRGCAASQRRDGVPRLLGNRAALSSPGSDPATGCSLYHRAPRRALTAPSVPAAFGATTP